MPIDCAFDHLADADVPTTTLFGLRGSFTVCCRCVVRAAATMIELKHGWEAADSFSAWFEKYPDLAPEEWQAT